MVEIWELKESGSAELCDPATAKTESSSFPSKPSGEENADIEVQASPDGETQGEGTERHILRDGPMVLHGARLHLAMLGMALSLFLSALESTIVATALTGISNYFQEYQRFTWIVTMYLVTYNGFLLLYAKMSDIIGRRKMFLLGLLIFTVFSGLCGAAQTMTQLIIFRAFQGVGGSGIYSMVMVMVPEMVPISLLGIYSGAISSVFAFASILGPLFGGIITDNSTWRWIFLLNLPIALISFFLVIFTVPGAKEKTMTSKNFARIDYAGFLLSLAASVLLIYALQTGGTYFPWKSGVIVGCLVGAGVAGVLYVWSGFYFGSHPTIEPILPFRLFRRPSLTFLLLSAFFFGASFYSTIINVPQRFQLVNATSAMDAGIKMLPLLLSSAVGSAVGGSIFSKKIETTRPTLVIGGALQALGVGLMASLPNTTSVVTREYGFEIIIGFGFGLMLPAFLLLSRLEVEEKDNAVVMGSFTSFRTLGGCVALAICDAIQNQVLPPKLSSFLSPAEMTLLQQSSQEMRKFSPETQTEVRLAYSSTYNTIFWSMAILATISVICGAFTFNKVLWWRKKKATTSNI